MKKIEELTKEDCQKFLLEVFGDKNILFNRLILKADLSVEESCGIEYNVKNELSPDTNQKFIISFSNPDFLSWLYKNDFDLTDPLYQLKFDFAEVDEANSALFEFAMGVNKIMMHSSIDENDAERLNEIKSLQKELIYKL